MLHLFFATMQVVKFIGSRKDLTEEKLDELEEMVMDSTKAEAIFDAAKMSMGVLVCWVVAIGCCCTAGVSCRLSAAGGVLPLGYNCALSYLPVAVHAIAPPGFLLSSELLPISTPENAATQVFRLLLVVQIHP
jgi:hypothetical protein